MLHLVLIKHFCCHFPFEFAALWTNKGVIGLLSYYMYRFRLNETFEEWQQAHPYVSSRQTTYNHYR